jgi:hypothetical protein
MNARPLKIAIVGASGFVGAALLIEALERGHTVTAIARNTQRIQPMHQRLISLSVDLFDAGAFTLACTDHDIIISAWSPANETPNVYEQVLQGAIIIQNAAVQASVPRLLVIGHAGSLFVAPSLQWVDTPEYPAAWRPIPAAQRDYLNLLQQETILNWSYITPPFDLVSGNRTAVYRTGTHSPLYNEQGRSTISVEDLAVAVLDEVETPQHSRQRFTVGY